MLKEIKVSVVIPTYNRADILKKAIQSVLNQSYPVYEIIVVDDGSSDHTSQVVKDFGSRVKYYQLENGGPARARNFGITKSSGEWVAFLDSDDQWLEDHLKLKVYMIGRYSDADFFSSLCSQNPQPIGHDFSAVDVQKLSLADIMTKNFIGVTSSVMIKKSRLMQMKCFRENLWICEDYDLWIRLAFLGPLYRILCNTVKIDLRSDGLSAGDRESTNQKYIAFIKDVFQQEFGRFKRYRDDNLALFFYECCVEYTEQKRFKLAFYYLWRSFFYNPLYLPFAKKIFTRTRRFFVVIRECLKGADKL